MISKISKILEDELCYVYCTNCKYDMDDDRCENCHRKYMNWELSEEEAIRIADKIIKALEDF